MADNTTQNLQDSNEELDKFNRSLRDSIDLAKTISTNIANLAGGIGNVGKNGRALINDLKDYSKTLQKTISLSDKLITGKLKEQEVISNIKKLTDQYNAYLKDSSKRNNDITQARKLQKQLQQDVLNKQQLQNALELEAEQLYSKRAEQLDEIRRAEGKIAQGIQTGNQVTISQGKKIAKEAKEKIHLLNLEIAEQTRLLDNNEKVLSKKQEELQKTKSIVQSHKDLKKEYEKQIKDNTKLLELAKEQTIQGKLKSKDLDKISSGLKDIKNLTTPFSAIFNFIKNIALTASDQVTKIQKSLVLTKEEGYAVRSSFQAMADASDDTFITTAKLLEANIQLSKQLGFNSKFSSDLNTQFVKLTKQIGISEEAAGGLAKLSKVNNTTLESTKNTALGTVQALSSQYGIQLDQKDVLDEIGKVSGQTLAMLKASPKAIAEAVAQSRLLGTNLDTVRKQAASLLDFETSIENELQAELITGQQLNLERARTAALTGDLTTAMQELNNQNIDFNKFSNMNVIAQDRMAAALGLSSDELSDQLLKQKYLGMSQEQVAAMAGEEVAKRLEALNAQDKFNAAVEKMQDIFGRIAAGPLGKFADILASATENATVLYSLMGAIAAVSLTKLVTGLAASAVQAGILAAGTAATASAITLGIGAVAIAAGITAMAAAYNKAKEEAAQPVGDILSSNGKTIVSTKEGGLFSLSNNDDFAAAPGLASLMNRPNQTTPAVDNTEMLSVLNSIYNEMKQTKEGIDSLNSKEGKVMMGSHHVGTVLNMTNTNFA